MDKYIQLSYQERRYIYRGKCERKSAGRIAKELGRDKSTITRELKRNGDHIGYLYPGEAQERTEQRKNLNVPKIGKDPELKAHIIEKLHERWSPKAIAGRWRLEHPGDTLCAETIYQWIYGKEGRQLGLSKLLIRRHKRRGFRRRITASNIKSRESIHRRPEEINQRVELGHWEADLAFNKDSQSKNVCTFIERVTRATIIIMNQNKCTSTVISSLIKEINKVNLPVKSITFDNGSEFTDHERLLALGIETYFCDPGSPWQKGSIENLNGVMRRYFPFNMPAHEITASKLQEVVYKLNNMPRAILGFKTPNEVAREMIYA